MTIFVYNPYERSKQVFQDIYKVERTSNGFRVYKDKDFYKDFPRLCVWWEIKETSNPSDPCENCIYNNKTYHNCIDTDFRFDLDNDRIICAMYEEK